MTKTTQESEDMVSTYYYSDDCEIKDDDGTLIPTYGKVSKDDIKRIEGYEYPIHRSLWSSL